MNIKERKEQLEKEIQLSVMSFIEDVGRCQVDVRIVDETIRTKDGSVALVKSAYATVTF